jgi:hypothetical protein
MPTVAANKAHDFAPRLNNLDLAFLVVAAGKNGVKPPMRLKVNKRPHLLYVLRRQGYRNITFGVLAKS